jgi:hypothetical protein
MFGEADVAGSAPGFSASNGLFALCFDDFSALTAFRRNSGNS